MRYSVFWIEMTRNAFQKYERPFLKKRNVLQGWKHVRVLSKRFFFLKKGQLLFWNVHFAVFFNGYFSLGGLSIKIVKKISGKRVNFYVSK